MRTLVITVASALLSFIGVVSAAEPIDTKFLQSFVIARSGINDLGETTVQQFVDEILSMSLNDGSSPKMDGWSRDNNVFTFIGRIF